MGEFITKGLTAADRKKFVDAWVDVEAESWAREQAKDVEPLPESAESFRPAAFNRPSP